MISNKSKTIRIFLIEDHHIMRHGLASLLTIELGAEIVGEAASGEEALGKLKDLEAPDIVIMDISLPGMNGIQATKKITSERPNINVLILSMYNNPTFVQQTLEAGAKGYLLKESLVDELKVAIEVIMNGKNYLSDKILCSFDFNIQDKIAQPYDPLTQREKDVFEKLANGMTVRDISEELVVSIYTVYTHISHIKQKLGIGKTTDMIRFAIENPLILKTNISENNFT
jgi:DNA-binding NarL/FixJ family response regulator